MDSLNISPSFLERKLYESIKKSPNNFIKYRQLIYKLYGENSIYTKNCTNNLLFRFRKKFGKDSIKLFHGDGVSLNPNFKLDIDPLPKIDNVNINIKLGKFIKEYRKSLGYSSRDLAKKAGLYHTTLVYIENGKRSTSLIYYHKILEALDIEYSIGKTKEF